MKLNINTTAEELEKNQNINDDAPIIGRYGLMFQEYLKANYPGRVTDLALTMTLWDICAEVNAEAAEMMWTIQERIKAQNPRPKTGDYMELLKYDTMIRDMAEEIVLQEVVYKYR